MRKYRAGIIGLGRMGSTIDDEIRDSLISDWIPYSIASACKAINEIELVAGADIATEKLEAFKNRWGVKALYTDYMEMIRREQLDIVAICTRGDLHAQMGIDVSEAKVPMIYLEKAIACSMREADALLAACRRNGTLLNTGVLRRFNHRFQKAKELIQNGEIGQPKAVVHYGSASLLHGHIHSIDTLMFLLGDPKIKSVWGELIPRTLSIEENRLNDDPLAIYQLEFENGVEGWTINAGNWDFEILGTSGSIRSHNNGIEWTIRRYNSTSYLPFPNSTGPSSTVTCLRDLIEAYETGRPTLGNIEIAYRATEACFAIAESHLCKSRIGLPIKARDLYIWHV